MKFNKNKKYCMICHDEYPNPMVSDTINLESDGWLFITLHWTCGSLARIEGVQTPMICNCCIHKIDVSNIAKQIEDYKIWLGEMVSQYDAGTVVEFERVK